MEFYRDRRAETPCGERMAHFVKQDRSEGSQDPGNDVDAGEHAPPEQANQDARDAELQHGERVTLPGNQVSTHASNSARRVISGGDQ